MNMKISFIDSSIIMSNYIINYYIIAIYKVSSISNTKTNNQLGLYFMSLKK